MFIFVNASVNNDGLSILLGTLSVYLLAALLRDLPQPVRDWHRYLVLGLVLGMGILTKLSLAGLLLVAGITVALLTWRLKDWKYLVLGGGIVLITSLVIALPWFVHNYNTYGDPTALNVFLEVQEQRSAPPGLENWIGEFGTLYRSFWGLFGGVNIAAPEFFYNTYNILFLIGIAGFVLWLLLRKRMRRDPDTKPVASNDVGGRFFKLPKGLWLLVIWTITVFILLIRWNYFAHSFQGRLLFPALGAINILWAAGLLSWLPAKFRNKALVFLSSLFFVMAGILPWIAIRPAYASPEPLASVPEDSQFGPISFDTGNGEIQLVGVEVAGDQIVQSGDGPVMVVLYWTAVEPVSDDYLSVVHLLGRGYQSVGFVNRYPAWGVVPTGQWQPGEIWRDVYHVTVQSDAPAPSILRIKAGLYDQVAKRDLPAFGPDGAEIDLLLVGEARLAADPKTDMEPDQALEVALDDGITFLGYSMNPKSARPGEDLQLSLYWLATGNPGLDLTVMVHLVDENGDQVFVADGPPVNGDYPTSFWKPGEKIVGERALQIPANIQPGDYQIVIGLYDPTSLVRVPRLDGTGDTIRWGLTISSGD
jgi:hypothetical protein